MGVFAGTQHSHTWINCQIRTAIAINHVTKYERPLKINKCHIKKESTLVFHCFPTETTVILLIQSPLFTLSNGNIWQDLRFIPHWSVIFNRAVNIQMFSGQQHQSALVAEAKLVRY